MAGGQNGICGVPVVPKSELWNLTWAEKKQVVGPLWIIRAGGGDLRMTPGNGTMGSARRKHVKAHRLHG